MKLRKLIPLIVWFLVGCTSDPVTITAQAEWYGFGDRIPLTENPPVMFVRANEVAGNMLLCDSYEIVHSEFHGDIPVAIGICGTWRLKKKFPQVPERIYLRRKDLIELSFTIYEIDLQGRVLMSVTKTYG